MRSLRFKSIEGRRVALVNRSSENDLTTEATEVTERKPRANKQVSVVSSRVTTRLFHPQAHSRV
jgi:hypothetical protein